MVDYEAVAAALGVSDVLVSRAAEHLHGIGLVTDEPATFGRNWSTGSIWLTPLGVQYAEGLQPIATVQPAGSTRAADEQKVEPWDLFISHASEDKEAVARPLADLLTGRGLRVWLDENELSIGDSLRAKIDQGLANSRHGLVILSKNFFEKDWPQRELDGLSALESANRKVILPVWHDVDRDYISRYSPTLADKFAARTNDGLDRVVAAVLRAIGRA